MDQVLDSGFWSRCVDIVYLTEPLVCVVGDLILSGFSFPPRNLDGFGIG